MKNLCIVCEASNTTAFKSGGYQKFFDCELVSKRERENKLQANSRRKMLVKYLLYFDFHFINVHQVIYL